MNQKAECYKTKNALLWMSLSNEPFVVLYAILPFIIRKDLEATLLQLSILASLRPVLSLFSFYWSANLTKQRHRLRSNLMGAWLLARLPFLLIPWINNSWYVIFCCGIYELFNRSGNPALIEILKINLQKNSRERIYNLSFVLSFLESILLGFVITAMLSETRFSWQTLFGIATLISLSSLLAQSRLPLSFTLEKPHIQENDTNKILIQNPRNNFTFKPRESCRNVKLFLEFGITPWKEAFALLQSKPDFFRFQCGFMLGGIGLMLAAPSFSLYCVDVLRLSHVEITLGRSVLMGLGVTLSSYFWGIMLSKHKIDQLLRNVLVGFSLYLFCLYLSDFSLSFFYVSFLLYGFSQAGSHLLWNLSGTLFSGNDDSSQFSRINILMVGLRGAIIPSLGGILCNYFGPGLIILLGSVTCLSGVVYVIFSTSKQNIIQNIRNNV